MKILIANGALTIKSGIAAELLKDEQGRIDLKNLDGDDLFTVVLEEGGRPSLSEKSMVCNAIVDGEAAYVVVAASNLTLESVKKRMGKAIRTAYYATRTINAQATQAKKAIDATFEEVTTEGAPGVEEPVEATVPAEVPEAPATQE